MPTKQIQRWASPRRILLATDLSDLEFTLPVAIQQALVYGAELKIAHILPNSIISVIDPVLMVNSEPDRMRKRAEKLLEQVVARVKAAGIECSLHLVEGDAVNELIQLSNKWEADRLVAGSHGKEKFHLHLLGSIAESLFHHIKIPVLAVGPKVVSTTISVKRRMRIVFSAALDQNSRRIAEFALSVAENHSADIWLMHAVPNIVQEHPTAVPVRTFANNMLQDLLTVRAVDKCRPVCDVVYGQPTESILEYAVQHSADMIILGASPHSAFDARFIPGTAYRVLCKSPCPVLVLKQEWTWINIAKQALQEKGSHAV